MKYVLLIHAADTEDVSNGCTPEDWMAYDKDLRNSGALVYGNSMADLTTSTVVRVADGGERTVTDGPFAEAREALGGFEVIDVPDLDAALEWAAKCPGSKGGGSVIVRPLADYDAPA